MALSFRGHPNKDLAAPWRVWPGGLLVSRSLTLLTGDAETLRSPLSEPTVEAYWLIPMMVTWWCNVPPAFVHDAFSPRHPKKKDAASLCTRKDPPIFEVG